ncbi:MAG: tetratricopeptide repeat protein [Xanthomonadales bacterium]|nr:tetratricopeptide repeat protein [Xanthomonadales bacterium]
MIRSTSFWILMTVFQLIFGLTVFALTRQYYLEAQDERGSATVAAHPPVSGWPAPSDQDDLANLISAGRPLSTDPDVLSAQADEFFGQAQYQNAAHLYEQALAAGGTDANTYNSLGLTLHYLGRSTEALNMLEQGIEVDPGYQRIWLTLGYVNSQLGNEAEARTALTTAVQMSADNEIGRSAASMLDNLR